MTCGNDEEVHNPRVHFYALPCENDARRWHGPGDMKVVVVSTLVLLTVAHLAGCDSTQKQVPVRGKLSESMLAQVPRRVDRLRRAGVPANGSGFVFEYTFTTHTLTNAVRLGKLLTGQGHYVEAGPAYGPERVFVVQGRYPDPRVDESSIREVLRGLELEGNKYGCGLYSWDVQHKEEEPE